MRFDPSKTIENILLRERRRLVTEGEQLVGSVSEAVVCVALGGNPLDQHPTTITRAVAASFVFRRFQGKT